MKHIPLLVIICICCASPLHAFSSLPADNPKYCAIKKIYDSIAVAFGDGRLPPRLDVIPAGADEDMIVAWSDPGSGGDVGLTGCLKDAKVGYIAVEERVYDLFSKKSSDREGSLAFIIGHELAHYYLRHGWVGDFANSFASLEVGKKMLYAVNDEEIIRRETEADYFGGFYGYLAGYDTLGAAPRALDLLYADYGLNDNVPNYPSRLERKQIAERVARNLRKMIPVFEGANILLVLEKYQQAARLFDFLARAFPSREILNNSGVAYAMEAVRLFPPGTKRFLYPFEFDAETRLFGSGRRSKGADPDAEQRTRLLRQAADAFGKALRIDKNYLAAKINLAAVNSLLGDNDTALVLVNQALASMKSPGDGLAIANALVVRGIAYAAIGNRERSLVDLAAARNSGSELALLNMALVTGDLPLRQSEGAMSAPSQQEETIAGISARSPFSRDKDTVSFTLQGNDNEPAITLHNGRGNGWQRTLVIVGSRLASTVATVEGYPGTSGRGVKIGDSLAVLHGKYGKPSRIVPARQGKILVFDKIGIAFAMATGGTVKGWYVFAVE